MKINTQEQLLDLAGQPIEAAYVGNQLANTIIDSRIRHSDSIRALELARSLHNNKEVDLTDADVAMLQNTLEKANEFQSALLNGQLRVIVNKLR